MKMKMLPMLLICLLSAPNVAAQESVLKNHLIIADSKIHPLTGHPSDQPRVRLEKRGERTFVVGSILINAPREKVWETLVDYDKSPELFKNLSLCKVIGTEGEVKLLRQLVKPGGPIKFDYIVRLTETKPSLIKWSRKSGSFKEVMGSWELEPIAKSTSTTVIYSIHLDGGFALPPWLLASQVKGYLPKMLNALKAKVESTHQGMKS
ncbi:MAG: SRPBCC family protein [Leptolyngbya sp.]|nr:SRPBCC family protein [Candidatus Melainabacteria bacterium]